MAIPFFFAYGYFGCLLYDIGDGLYLADSGLFVLVDIPSNSGIALAYEFVTLVHISVIHQSISSDF